MDIVGVYAIDAALIIVLAISIVQAVGLVRMGVGIIMRAGLGGLVVMVHD